MVRVRPAAVFRWARARAVQAQRTMGGDAGVLDRFDDDAVIPVVAEVVVVDEFAPRLWGDGIKHERTLVAQVLRRIDPWVGAAEVFVADDERCTYITIRIDDQILPLAKAAAALSGNVTVQDFISDAVNEVASRVIRRQPIARRPPPPKPKSPGRPPLNRP